MPQASFLEIADLPESWRNQYSRFCSDHLSGATHLAEQAVDLVQRWSRQLHAAVEVAQRQAALIELCRTLQRQQPSMAPLLVALNGVLNETPAAAKTTDWTASISHWANCWRQQSAQMAEATTTHAMALIPESSRLLTHSRSSLVERTLIRSADAIREVICCEARPLYEGRGLAQALAGAGLRSRLIIDAAIASVLQEVDIVLIGADALLPTGLVNKVGTRNIALAALNAGVPCYALCPSDRCAGEGAATLLRFAEQPVEEVWDDAPAAVAVQNQYFDVTPGVWLQGLVSELGVCDADTLLARTDVRLNAAWNIQEVS